MSKTTLIAASVAAACASLGGTVALADPVNLYGTVEVRSIDRDGVDLDTFLDAARLGAKQVIRLEKFDDLKARWQIEYDLPVNGSLGTDGTDSGDASIRKAQINLIGGFGEVILGRQNHLMAGAKKIDQFKNDSGAFVIGPDRIGNAISYVTPSFGGINGYVQVISDVDADLPTDAANGVVPDKDLDGTTFGVSVNGEGYNVEASYFQVDEDFAFDEATGTDSEVELVSLGGSVDVAGVNLFGTYQSEDVSGTDMWGLGAAYSVNDTTFKAGYSTTDNDAGGEGSYIQLLADYNLGQGVSAFVQYIEYDSDAEDTLGKGDALSVGIAYNFSTDIAM